MTEQNTALPPEARLLQTMFGFMVTRGLSVVAALGVADELAKTTTPNADAMARHIEATGGMIFAEALSFALAEAMPRPAAQAEVKAFVGKAKETRRTLADVTREAHPDLPLGPVFDARAQLGIAPDEARAFAEAARAV